VHAAAGVDEAGGDDGQRAAVFDFASRAEEAFGDFQSAVIQSAGHGAAAAGATGVEGAADAGQAVEQHHDVAAELHFAFAALDDERRHFQMFFNGVVIGRSVNGARNVALHVGHFLGTFIDEEKDQFRIRVVGVNA